jgi:hypothetical protein
MPWSCRSWFLRALLILFELENSRDSEKKLATRRVISKVFSILKAGFVQ